MAIRSGFFNSIDDDRLYNAEDMSHYFEGLISNGVFESIGDKLQVTAGENMTVNIGTGRAMIDCHWLKNDAVYNLPIAPADVQLKRADVVVVKLDLTTREMTIEIIQGTPSTTYAIPKITNTQDIKYLRLAYIRIAERASSISQANIVDMRGNTYWCGYITGLIEQVDTSQLFAQWQDACETFYENMTNTMTAFFNSRKAEFDEWYSTLTDQLIVDTTIKRYQNSYITTEETDTLPIGIAEYETGDILFVNINGVDFVQDVEFTINDSNIVLKNTIRANNRVTFVVLKSQIGNSSNPVQDAAIATTELEGTVATASFEEVE